MRLLMINLLATALVLFSAGFASAFELRLVGPAAGTSINVGDVISYDIFLDTQGGSGIVLFAAQLEFDQSVLAYRQDLSDAEDYYPLYAPGAKANPPTYLTPIADPFNLWGGTPPPSGNDIVQIEFIESNLNPSAGTATNLWLGTVAFEAIAPGSSPNDWGFDALPSASIFSVDNVDIKASVTTPGGGTINVIPEPTTALLVGLGLVGLGAAGRRRA